MRSALRSLRVRFAALTFVAIYLPVTVLFLVVRVQDSTVEVDEGVILEETVVNGGPSTAVLLTTIGLLPVAAALAWWLSGIAVRPVTKAIEVQRRLVEEASHELRTPLAVLINNAEVLVSHPEPDLDIYREGIERSGAAAVRMQTTIDALLVDARGRARTIERTSTDMVRLCEAVCNQLAADAEAKSVTLEVRSDGSFTVPVDEPSISRAVTNLVANAINHSGGTMVEVSVTAEGGGRTAEVIVSVTDDGVGIPAEEQDRIFDRFWTAGRSGTGLGLSITRQIAEAHGGTLTVTSPVADGAGTRFTLRLRS